MTPGVRIAAENFGGGAAFVLEAGELTVPAVFERSFYVEDVSGRLACFLRSDAECGPLNILCHGWRPPAEAGLRPGASFRRSGSLLRSGALTVDLSACKIWTPPPPPPFVRDLFQKGKNRFRAEAAKHAPPDTLLAHVARSCPHGAPPDRFGAALRERVDAGLARFRDWLASPEGIPEDGVFGLIGLGPGLTPSGDDIVAGAVLALRVFGRSETAETLKRAILSLPEGMTNSISRAHLHAAAEGGGAGIYLRILDSVLLGGGELPALLPGLSGIGHSSGWDTALGFWVCLDAV